MSVSQTTVSSAYPREQSRLFLPSKEAIVTLKLQANGVSKSDKAEAEDKASTVPGWTPV
jgi:hypothetical protein